MTRARTIDRRAFLAGAGGGVGLLSVTDGLGLLGRDARAAAWMLPDTSPETPNAHERATMMAIADTFIPNWDGAPGALETDAFATLNDPFYGLNPYVSEIVADLDDWCWWRYWWADFVDLSTANRNKALEERMGFHGSTIQSWYKDAYEGALSLTKLNYFGGLVNAAGTNYVGFPGPSAGYAPSSAAGAYASADTPKAIPDNAAAGVASAVAVAGEGTISSLEVTVYVKHARPGDLVIKLVSPAGTAHTLYNRVGGAAPDVVLAGVAVGAFAGQAAAGTWTLRVQDLAGGTAGSLRHWSFKLRTSLDG
jgi:Proprotein convertase P-domain